MEITMATQPAPKNKRLNDRDRAALYRFAARQIEATEDRSELDAAYERAATAINAFIVKANPPKDMAVLEKYGCANNDECIYVSTGGSNYDRFEFRDGDKRIPLRPNNRDCYRQPILLIGEAEEAYDAYKAAVKATEAARDKRLNDFNALIYGTPSFNAIAEVWPAAETMRGQIVGTVNALAVLSSEVVDRLKADPALMAEAA